MEKNVYLKIVELRVEFPGVTLGLAKLLPIEKGWIVKVKNAGNFESFKGFEKAVEIAMETSKTISGYITVETELWDVIEVFDDEETATKAGKFHEQMTIYNIETGTLKWID